MDRSNLRKLLSRYKVILITAVVVIGFTAAGANIHLPGTVNIPTALSIGTTSDPSSKAVIDAVSTTKGFLAPRMTTTQQNAITSPPEGLRIHNTTLHLPAYYNGSAWLDLASLTGTETLTQKTISGSSNTLSNIGYSSLSLSTSIVNTDISTSAAIAYSKLNLSGSIVNADVNASAGIVDTKLATISTAGKVSNSATTATNANTNSAIVARDGSGNFSAGTITANLTGNVTGNADTATALAANPSDCGSDTYATTIAASGNLTCSTVTNAGLAGSIAASKLVGSDIATVGTITSGTWSGTTVAVNKGGTGQTSYTDGQLLIGNSSGTTLTKATLTPGANVTITNGNGSITIAASSTATPAYTYTSQSSTLNPAVIGNYYLLSGASFTITLPTAASISGQSVIFQHNGTSLTQVYTFNTTSSQTINGPGGTVVSGSYAMYTNGEKLVLYSDGANWQVVEHDTTTKEADAGALWISKSSAYSMTISSASIAAGTTYTTPNGCAFIVSTTTSASTNLLLYGTCAPNAANNTLTYAGTGTAGDRPYTAVSSAGAYIKATSPAYDRFIWYRTGQYVNYRWEFSSANSGTAGTGDDLLYLPTGLSMDTTNMATQTGIFGASYPTQWSDVGYGHCFCSGVNNHMRMFPAWPGTLKGLVEGGGAWSSGGGTFNTTPRWSIVGKYPVTGWQP